MDKLIIRIHSHVNAIRLKVNFGTITNVKYVNIRTILTFSKKHATHVPKIRLLTC